MVHSCVALLSVPGMFIVAGVSFIHWKHTVVDPSFVGGASVLHAATVPGSYWLNTPSAPSSSSGSNSNSSANSSTAASGGASSSCQGRLLRLLKQPIMLVADLGTAAGRRSHRLDDEACTLFRETWQRSQQLHPSLLVYNTGRHVTH